MSARTDPRGGYQAIGIPTATAAERDTKANCQRREAFVASLRAVAPENLIYLDESGVSTQMTRLYARAEGGQRVQDAVPGGHWKMLTILGAMSGTAW